MYEYQNQTGILRREFADPLVKAGVICKCNPCSAGVTKGREVNTIYVVEVDLMGVKYYQIITHVTYKEKS